MGCVGAPWMSLPGVSGTQVRSYDCLNPRPWSVLGIPLLLVRRGRDDRPRDDRPRDDRPSDRARSPPRGERKRDREPSPSRWVIVCKHVSPESSLLRPGGYMHDWRFVVMGRRRPEDDSKRYREEDRRDSGRRRERDML